MQPYRQALPQLGGGLFLTDGGLETTLIFHDGLTLPDFAAFHLLQSADGEAALRKYYLAYAAIARQFGAGLILESATWRASADWGRRLGYSSEALAQANRSAVRLLEDIRATFAAEQIPVVISGCVGPRGDGYIPASAMTEQEAEDYHGEQIAVFATTAADMICAITMNYVEEATGLVRAARRAGMPVAVSFTVETDGRLPTGQTLQSAIEQVDAATSGYPAYFMINCAHPSHFAPVLAAGGAWLERIHGLRANASCKSHDELNEATELDAGDPVALAAEYAALRQPLRNLNVMGGCCGTDHRHVGKIAEVCRPLWPA